MNPSPLKLLPAIGIGFATSWALNPLAVAAGTNWVTVAIGGTTLFLAGQAAQHRYNNQTN